MNTSQQHDPGIQQGPVEDWLHCGSPSCLHDLSTELPSLGPMKNVEFPPLSQQTVAMGETMSTTNPVDLIVLQKSNPVVPGQEDEPVTKELNIFLHETEAIISFGLRYVRHLNAMTLELQLLLEHEQKILEQVMTRIDKFKVLRDENKRKATEWENDYMAKTPEYEEFVTKLINVPHAEELTPVGVPPPVQQKILFQIVSRSTNTANRVVVQLSMEEAVANDIDLTLQDLKKHCAVMLRQITSWLRLIKSQLCHQGIVIERWDETKNIIKGLKTKGDEVSMIGAQSIGGSFNFKKYEERLRIVEEAICNLCGEKCGTCPNVEAPKPTQKSGRIDSLCQAPPYVNGPGNRSTSPPTPGVEPTIAQAGAYTTQGSGPGTTRSTPQPRQGMEQMDPYNQRLQQIEEAVRKMCAEVSPHNHPDSSSEQGDCSPDEWDMIRAGPDSPMSPLQGGVTPQPPGIFSSTPYTPRSDGYIEDPYIPPALSPPGPAGGSEGLRRNRAPPGMFPDIELVDTPGMGYPVPRAALERGGRPPGQTVPLSPTSPKPTKMGRFRPLAVSSPGRGDTPVLRPRQPPTPLPPNPMAGQPVDPALLPKIQEDLRRLGERNKNLQELVNNFKCIRARLTDEIDNAVRLNQKLQRDLYYVAEAQR